MEWSQEGIVTGLREQDPAAVRDWVTRYTPSIQRVGMSYLNDNDQAAKLTKAVFPRRLPPYKPVLPQQIWKAGC